MRTKALLLTAALGAVGLSTSIAQTVYSVNAVGFVNVAVPKGFSIIANPLDNANNNITNLFSGADDGTTVYKFDATSGFSINAYDALAGEWGIANQTLVPGEGAFINSPAAHTFTFIGE